MCLLKLAAVHLKTVLIHNVYYFTFFAHTDYENTFSRGEKHLHYDNL